MGKKTIKADKLQEVIMAKTMGSIAGVPAEAPKTSKKAEPKKSTKEGSKKESKTKADKAPAKKETKKASAPREVKYIYPEDCTGSLDKKKFRAEFRAKVRQLEAKLEKAKEGTKEYKAIAKELKEYKAQYLRG